MAQHWPPNHQNLLQCNIPPPPPPPPSFWSQPQMNLWNHGDAWNFLRQDVHNSYYLSNSEPASHPFMINHHEPHMQDRRIIPIEQKRVSSSSTNNVNNQSESKPTVSVEMAASVNLSLQNKTKESYQKRQKQKQTKKNKQNSSKVPDEAKDKLGNKLRINDLAFYCEYCPQSFENHHLWNDHYKIEHLLGHNKSTKITTKPTKTTTMQSKSTSRKDITLVQPNARTNTFSNLDKEKVTQLPPGNKIQFHMVDEVRKSVISHRQRAIDILPETDVGQIGKEKNNEQEIKTVGSGYKCYPCDMEFRYNSRKASRRKHKKHMRIHAGNFKCGFCKISFNKYLAWYKHFKKRNKKHQQGNKFGATQSTIIVSNLMAANKTEPHIVDGVDESGVRDPTLQCKHSDHTSGKLEATHHLRQLSSGGQTNVESNNLEKQTFKCDACNFLLDGQKKRIRHFKTNHRTESSQQDMCTLSLPIIKDKPKEVENIATKGNVSRLTKQAVPEQRSESSNNDSNDDKIGSYLAPTNTRHSHMNVDCADVNDIRKALMQCNHRTLVNTLMNTTLQANKTAKPLNKIDETSIPQLPNPTKPIFSSSSSNLKQSNVCRNLQASNENNILSKTHASSASADSVKVVRSAGNYSLVWEMEEYQSSNEQNVLSNTHQKIQFNNNKPSVTSDYTQLLEEYKEFRKSRIPFRNHTNLSMKNNFTSDSIEEVSTLPRTSVPLVTIEDENDSGSEVQVVSHGAEEPVVERILLSSGHHGWHLGDNLVVYPVVSKRMIAFKSITGDSSFSNLEEMPEKAQNLNGVGILLSANQFTNLRAVMPLIDIKWGSLTRQKRGNTNSQITTGEDGADLGEGCEDVQISKTQYWELGGKLYLAFVLGTIGHSSYVEIQYARNSSILQRLVDKRRSDTDANVPKCNYKISMNKLQWSRFKTLFCDQCSSLNDGNIQHIQ